MRKVSCSISEAVDLLRSIRELTMGRSSERDRSSGKRSLIVIILASACVLSDFGSKKRFSRSKDICVLF